ncbi:MAG: tRNA (guanine(6)-N2)-methyltransferase [Sulfolobales archaeon]|nr:tRNA (guanine(6)-N2)-methyltransferase [Ignisphaera sp.]MCX8199721.1 tRNA (guanine(6)-N2)-methyltransferase [Sulfolobales archaeon]MDW8085860.1 tRNA (guanine(6)-N2)-methyltransferase [Ignisphaera sp.]
MIFLVTCDTGFESVLTEELTELTNCSVKHVSSGRVFIEAPSTRLIDILRSRIANNLYMLICIRSDIAKLEDIYSAVRELDFTEFIDPTQSFAIRSERIGRHSFTSIDISRVAGQAVIDSYISLRKTRLRVDLENPDVEIYIELNRDKLIVGLALFRTSMHVRRYRLFNHPVALKPTIAASMLRLAGWRPTEGVIDPMCGGGTIVIEAALVSKGIEIPCINKQNINVGVLRRVSQEVDRGLEKLCRKSTTEGDYHRAHIGIDINPRFVEGSAVNAKSAGVDDAAVFLVGDSLKLVPKVKQIEYEFGACINTAVFNPPYGYRMKPQRFKRLSELYMGILNVLKDHSFRRVVFITSATRVAERALSSFRDIAVNRVRVVYGTLQSCVYIVNL